METEREGSEEIVNVANEQTRWIGDAHKQTIDIERIEWS